MMTFVFLIFNTVFAVITSIVYKSRTLLLFSFIFAYLNPFLIWAKSNGTPYTLSLYSLSVSFWALFLSYFYRTKKDEKASIYLLEIAFYLWNILFLVVPFTSSFMWIFKLVFIWILSVSVVSLAYNFNYNDRLWRYFISMYVIFVILLINSMHFILNSWFVLLFNCLFLLWMIFSSIFLIANWIFKSIKGILFAPLIIILWLLFTWNLYFALPVFSLFAIIYFVIFAILWWVFSVFFSYIYFVVLSIFLILWSVHFRLMSVEFTFMTGCSIAAMSILFQFISYFFSRKKSLEYLYSIWSIWTIFVLLPIISTDSKSEFFIFWILTLIVYFLLNVIIPFFNKNLIESNVRNISLWMIAWIVFIWWELYNFWQIAKFFPWITTWFAFAALAALYFVLGFAMFNVLGLWQKNASKENSKDVIYSYLWTALSLFSIAVLIVFSDKAAIVAAIWLFEATILYYFYSLKNDIKVYIWACLLFAIWIWKYLLYTFSMTNGDFAQLIPVSFIWASLILNLKFLKNNEKQERMVHDIFHVIAMLILCVWVSNIVPHTGKWFSFFAISIIISIIIFIYNLFTSIFLAYILLFLSSIFYFIHATQVWDIFAFLEYNKIASYKIFQYVMLPILWIWVSSTYFISWKLNLIKTKFLIAFVVYSFVITSYFVYNLSNNNVFALTIYWALWAFAYLYNWINSDKWKYRTIGLYILTLVLFKILFYDIWYWINDTVFRVVALMFVWALMMYISTLYSKRYPWNLLKEFNIWSFWISWNNNSNVELNTEKHEEKIKSDDKVFVVNQKIKDIDIKDIISVRFEIWDWNKITIKSKNLIRISLLVTNHFQKMDFTSGELESIYDFVKNNYKSDLSKTDYDKIISITDAFVKFWGKVIYVRD